MHAPNDQADASVATSKCVKDTILQALGPDPTLSYRIELVVDEEIAVRMKAWIRDGLQEANLDFLMQQYVLPGFLTVPKLNPEIEAYLQRNAKDRDGHMMDAQLITAVSLASLCGNFIVLMDEEVAIDDKTRNGLISITLDSAMLQAQAFHEAILNRRAFVLRSIKAPEVRELLDKQPTDELLFGKDLDEKLKTLKSLSKTAKQFETQDSGKITAKSFLDRRNAHPARNNQPWAKEKFQRYGQQKSFHQRKPNYQNNNKQQKNRSLTSQKK